MSVQQIILDSGVTIDEAGPCGSQKRVGGQMRQSVYRRFVGIRVGCEPQLVYQTSVSPPDGAFSHDERTRRS